MSESAHTCCSSSKESPRPRRFTSSQRVALLLAAQGSCQRCTRTLDPSWNADHLRPWVAGGTTDTTNGQALCPGCNLEWHDGDNLVSATFEDELDPRSQSRRLRTALDADTDFVRTMLSDAHRQLRQLRDGDRERGRAADPDAAGLVLAMDQQHALRLPSC